jgi:predicted PurR-regulated permease PerM
VLIVVAAFIIAAFLLLAKEKSVAFYRHLSYRLMGNLADEWVGLSALTVRSVATGVIGVAVIQATLALAGMLAMDVPFALLLALGVMFMTIIQVPALVVIGPVIAYVFSQGSGTAEVVFAVYMLVVGASDGVLKPMLMGRGVDIPMLVVLIGAIGGMILWGMIGLFVGAVIFALTYKLFGLWLAEAVEDNRPKNGAGQ